jgi:cell division protein FtsB
MEFFYNLLPVLLSFLFALLVYLVKAIINLANRVLALELKIEILIKEVERLRCSDKENIKE